MDKIDLIIDALECAKQQTIKGVMYPAGYHMMLAQALAAARSLRELKPVAYLNISGYFYIKVPQSADPSYYTPLYALDEVTK
jgi:hypothetical protein